MAGSFTDGAAYERLMGQWSRRVAVPFLDWLQPTRGLDWIDVGCGNGAFSEEVVTRCAPRHLSGIDPSPDQIAFARVRLASGTPTDFALGDAQALVAPDQSFDVAAMALVLAFLPDPLGALREMARVVRPGGQVAAYMWDMPGGGVPLRPLYRACVALGHGAQVPPSSAVSALEPMHQLWVDAGLQSVESRRIDITVSFADFDDFWDSSSIPIGPQGQLLANLTPAQIAEVKDALRAMLPTAADGSISYPAFASAVKGRVSA
jgi:SAM-dependent methyltransferase